MKKRRVKKLIFLITTYFTILLTVKAGGGNSKNDSYPYNEVPYETIAPYTTYSKGSVYIADAETIKRIIVDSCDLYVIDDRGNEKNPDMCICNSYKIRSKEDIREIVEILLQYESEFPSDWERTAESMYNEIRMHNKGFDLGYKETRTRDVDLDNNDEEKFNNPMLSLLLK